MDRIFDEEKKIVWLSLIFSFFIVGYTDGIMQGGIYTFAQCEWSLFCKMFAFDYVLSFNNFPCCCRLQENLKPLVLCINVVNNKMLWKCEEYESNFASEIWRRKHNNKENNFGGVHCSVVFSYYSKVQILPVCLRIYNILDELRERHECS